MYLSLSHIQKFLSLAMIALLLTSCFDKTTTTHQWTLQTQAVESSIDHQELLSFSKNVATMSNQRLIINVIPANEIAIGSDIYGAVRQGKLEMANGWPNWWSGNHPAWALMNAGPFDFMNIDASMMFFLSGSGTDLANQLTNPDGIIWRPAWWPGMEFGLIAKKPVNGLDDLKNKRIRIGPGLPSEVLTEAAKAYTIPLMPHEILPAFESGDVDAVEWTTASGAWDLGLHNVGKHAIVPAIWQPSVLSDFLINQAAYDRLSPDLKAILESAIKSFTLQTTMQSKVADFAALERLKAHGVSIKRWTPNDIKRWKVANEKILVEYTNRDEFTRKVLTEKKKFKSTYQAYYHYFGSYESDDK